MGIDVVPRVGSPSKAMKIHHVRLFCGIHRSMSLHISVDDVSWWPSNGLGTKLLIEKMVPLQFWPSTLQFHHIPIVLLPPSFYSLLLPVLVSWCFIFWENKYSWYRSIWYFLGWQFPTQREFRNFQLSFLKIYRQGFLPIFKSQFTNKYVYLSYIVSLRIDLMANIRRALCLVVSWTFQLVGIFAFPKKIKIW